MKRRDFITSLAAGSLATPYLFGASKNTSENSYVYKDNIDLYQSQKQNKNLILPKALKKGSKIAITAPASPTSMGQISSTVKSLQSLGFDVVIGETIKNSNSNYRYFSHNDQFRANEFMDFIKNPNIDAIFCGRGGYGVMRILNLLDYELIKNNPKIILGFSDITALLNAVTQLSGLVTFHGPVASNINSYSLEYLSKVLFQENQFKEIPITSNKINIYKEGEAEGKLIGGNLKLLISTLGTPFEINIDNSILFIEEVSEHPYQIDRMLTQLALSGKLNKCRAIAFGEFTNLKKRLPFYPNTSFTIDEVINQIITPLNIPVIQGLPIGHIDSQVTIPIGSLAKIDTSQKSLTIKESSVIF